MGNEIMSTLSNNDLTNNGKNEFLGKPLIDCLITF